MPFSLDSIPDQHGRVAIVTGANSGIGLVTAQVLASKGARVIMACRSQARAEEAIAKIHESCPEAELVFSELDLCELQSVKSFAERILAQEPRLDLLINNAGVMMPKERSETVDGFELQFGVNHLGHQCLTALLLDRLDETPGSRVVSVASQAHRGGKIDFEDLQWQKRGYRRIASYGQSKLANLMFSFELDRRLKAAGRGVIAVAAHPGYTATELQRTMPGKRVLNACFAMSADKGAMPSLRAATDPSLQGGEYIGLSGFLEMRGQPVPVGSSKRAQDRHNAEQLWNVSEELTGVSFEGLHA